MDKILEDLHKTLAQELLEYHPEFVMMQDHGYLAVDYTGLLEG